MYVNSLQGVTATTITGRSLRRVVLQGNPRDNSLCSARDTVTSRLSAALDGTAAVFGMLLNVSEFNLRSWSGIEFDVEHRGRAAAVMCGCSLRFTPW